MTLTEHHDLQQRSPEWYAARCGIVTASAVGSLITVGPPDAGSVACPTCNAAPDAACVSVARKQPTALKGLHEARSTAAASRPPTISPAANDYTRALTLLLVAERITGYVEPTYQSDDMVRGMLDEPLARELYSEHHAPTRESGFMVRDDWGWKLGYSPDGLVGDDGLIEVKSRRQKKHLQTILAGEVPQENMAQMQCGLLVSGRRWCDYVSFCGGMPLWVKRVEPDLRWSDAIVAAVEHFERSAAEMISAYHAAVEGLPQTERFEDVVI